MKYISNNNFRALPFLIFSFSSTFGAETAQQSPGLGLVPSGMASIKFRLYSSCWGDSPYRIPNACIDVPYYVVTSDMQFNVLDTFSSGPLNPEKRTQEEVNNIFHKRLEQGPMQVFFSHDMQKAITKYVHKTYPQCQKLEYIEYGPKQARLKPNDGNYVLEPRISQYHNFIRAHFSLDPEKIRLLGQENQQREQLLQKELSLGLGIPKTALVPQEQAQVQQEQQPEQVQEQQQERPSQSEGLSSKIYKILRLRWILQAIYAIRECLY